MHLYDNYKAAIMKIFFYSTSLSTFFFTDKSSHTCISITHKCIRGTESHDDQGVIQFIEIHDNSKMCVCVCLCTETLV